jgi:hypothetical protein
MSINDSWTAAPASGSGHAQAAPAIHDTPEPPGPRMTIDGRPADALRAPAPAAPAPSPADPAAPNTSAADAFAAVQQADRAFRQHFGVIAEHADQLTPQGQQAAIRGFQESTAAQAVGATAEAVRKYRDQTAAEAARVRDSLSVEGDTAAELRATRAWQRHKAILDRAEDGKVGVVAQRAIADAAARNDRAELSTLIQEVPDYFAARGQDSGFLDAALRQAVPEYAEAQRVARDAERLHQVTVRNADALRGSYGTGRPPAVLVDPSALRPSSG